MRRARKLLASMAAVCAMVAGVTGVAAVGAAPASADACYHMSPFSESDYGWYGSYVFADSGCIVSSYGTITVDLTCLQRFRGGAWQNDLCYGGTDDPVIGLDSTNCGYYWRGAVVWHNPSNQYYWEYEYPNMTYTGC